MLPAMDYNSQQLAAHPSVSQVHGPESFMEPPPKGRWMARFRSYLQHRLNPLHVYCRLCERGISRPTARKLSSVYERIYRVCGLGA